MSAAITDSPHYKRLYWHSRRGMLELDLILVPFFENCFASLDVNDQASYERLLTAEDQDLFSWFLGRAEPEDRELIHIVSLIKRFARTNPTSH